jgi:5S rRNA maturation endonuclease (ribonuclease M5)
MNLTSSQIYQILNYLRIETFSDPDPSGWVKIRCIVNDAHVDNTPSAGINVQNGVVKCFKCGKSHISTILKEKYNLNTYKEFLNFINNNITSIYLEKKPEEIKPQKIKPKKKEFPFSGVITELDPSKYYYTRQRGFTKEFVEKFNIKRSLSNPYMDYMIIPIVDSKKGINLFEPRKLMQKEYLTKFFKIKNRISYEKMVNDFDYIVKQYGLSLDKYKSNVIAKKECPTIETFNNYICRYLLLPKVWYPGNTEINKTIFNIDNLDYNKTLYVCEGFASLPKLMKVFGNNVTCTFGSQITEDQINYLKKFKKIVIIPDDDEAGLHMVEILHKDIKDTIYVLPIEIEDTDENFEEELKNTEIIESNKYIVPKNFYAKLIGK